MSVVILVAVMTSVFGILKTALSANIDVRHRIIALNIAREGIEGVRNIRDTNWLKYSGDRRGKWLCNDTSTSPDSCDGTAGTTLTDGFYKLDFVDLTQSSRYFLITGTPQGEINVDAEGFSDYQLWERDDKRYIHVSVSGTTIKDANNIAVTASATPFYRQIQLDRIECSSGSGCLINEDDKKLRVISRVQWKEEEAVKTVTLETYLYDYYKLDEYPSS